MKRKYKVGEIIYPYYNGTHSFFKRSRWDLVLKVDKNSYPIRCRHLWYVSSVETIEAMNTLAKEQDANK